MNTKLISTCFIMGALLAPLAGYTADADADRSQPGNYVKDSVITTKIKAKLAVEKMRSLMHIKVDTDKDGVVWLSGNAQSQEEIDKAGSIAQETEGVKSVNNDIKINNDL